MPTNDISVILQGSEFLAGLPEEYVAQIADCATVNQYEFGHYLFFEGDPADKFYLVASGKVGLESNAGSIGFFTIETLRDGETIGWSWMFPPYRWSLTARVLAPTSMVEFDAVSLRKMCETDSRFKYLLMRQTAVVSAQRLLAARLTLIKNCG